MAVSKPIPDYASEFNSLYKITADLAGWDKTTIQVVAPIGGGIAVLATNDSGAVEGQTQGNADLAINFSHVQVKNLETGTSVNYIYGAGLYEYDVNAQFLRLSGTPAAAGTNVYKLLLFNSKIG